MTGNLGETILLVGVGAAYAAYGVREGWRFARELRQTARDHGRNPGRQAALGVGGFAHGLVILAGPYSLIVLARHGLLIGSFYILAVVLLLVQGAKGLRRLAR